MGRFKPMSGYENHGAKDVALFEEIELAKTRRADYEQRHQKDQRY